MIVLTSSIFGFPDFRSLVELRSDGTAHFSAGMVAEGPGLWSVEQGNEVERESPDDIYLKFTQPLTKKYMKVFSVPAGTCFWKIKIVTQGSINKAGFEDGLVVSLAVSGKNQIREGTFGADVADEELIKIVRGKSREAFEKALTVKGESTGFKTPARIAGVRKQIGGEKKFIDKTSTTKDTKALKGGKADDDDDVEKQ